MQAYSPLKDPILQRIGMLDSGVTDVVLAGAAPQKAPFCDDGKLPTMVPSIDAPVVALESQPPLEHSCKYISLMHRHLRWAFEVFY